MDTTTRDYATTYARTDRPCIRCGTTIEDGDRYCMHCGETVSSLADAILDWTPNPNERSLGMDERGAALARKVRTLLTPFKAYGVRVRTESSYYVNVTLPKPNFWGLRPGEYAPSIVDTPYQSQWHQAHFSAAEEHLRTILHRFYYGTAGQRDTDPGADYPYLSLPVLTVNGLG